MTWKSFNRWFWLGGAGLAVGAELCARFLGFHNTPLYEHHEAFEYCTAPNQSGRVWGNRYETNALGIRGEMPDTSQAIVWVCGDSVINGGVYCDEDSLAVSQVDNRLEHALGIPVSTVNISQGSWGPGNTWGFVKHYGDQLGSPDAIALVLNSQDWRDEMTHCYSGDSNDMPSTSSFLGLVRVVKELRGDDRTCEALTERRGDTREDLLAWISFAKEKEIPLMVHMHPSAEELGAQTWSNDGKRLIEFLTAQGVVVNSGLSAMIESDYRDQIHLNHAGQGHLATALAPLVHFMMTTQ